jgi:hypothetical protein
MCTVAGTTQHPLIQLQHMSSLQGHYKELNTIKVEVSEVYVWLYEHMAYTNMEIQLKWYNTWLKYDEAFLFQ